MAIHGRLSLDLPPNCPHRQAGRELLVQTLFAHTPNEALDQPVLHGLAGSDVVAIDTVVLLPSNRGFEVNSVPSSEITRRGSPRRRCPVLYNPLSSYAIVHHKPSTPL